MLTDTLAHSRPDSLVGAIDRAITAERLWRYPPILLGITATLYATTLARSTHFIEPNGKVIGRDFLAFYTGGALVNEGRLDDLYSPAIHTAFQEQFMADINPQWQGTYPYRNPPHYAWAMSWLAKLTYGRAILVWTGISLACFAATTLIWRTWLDRSDWKLVVMLAICMPAWFQALAGGQNTFISLLILTGFCALLMKGRDGWAGLVLSVLSYKFYLIALPAGLLLVKKRWRVIGGLALGGAVTLAFTAAVMGPGMIADYVHFAPSQATLMDEDGFDIHKQHCWYGFFRLLGAGWMPTSSVGILAITASIATVAALIPCWRGRWPDDRARLALGLGVLMIVTLATSAHLLHYDMLLAALPAVLWLRADRAGGGDEIAVAVRVVLLAGCLWLAVGGPIARLTHVQLSPLLMLGWAMLMARTSDNRLSQACRDGRVLTSARTGP